LDQRNDLLFGVVRVKGSALPVDAIAVRLTACPFATGALDPQRRAGPGGRQAALEFRHGVLTGAAH
jgi:hypothetical protein